MSKNRNKNELTLFLNYIHCKLYPVLKHLLFLNFSFRPQDVFDDLYLHYTTLKTINSLNLNNNNLSSEATRSFDSAVAQVFDIITSYDMGWSKRGNGKSYNSLNRYGSIIGF